jgi:hypothetical protein
MNIHEHMYEYVCVYACVCVCLCMCMYMVMQVFPSLGGSSTAPNLPWKSGHKSLRRDYLHVYVLLVGIYVGVE